MNIFTNEILTSSFNILPFQLILKTFIIPSTTIYMFECVECVNITSTKDSFDSIPSVEIEPEVRTNYTMANFDSVPSVEIDPEGTYKYILIKLYEKNVKNEDGSEKFKYLVRGNSRGEYHGDIYDEFMSKLNTKLLDSECIGGGRIKHIPNEKKLVVYGYSQGFGKADHSITKNILQEKYKNYNIDWSDEGY